MRIVIYYMVMDELKYHPLLVKVLSTRKRVFWFIFLLTFLIISGISIILIKINYNILIDTFYGPFYLSIDDIIQLNNTTDESGLSKRYYKTTFNNKEYNYFYFITDLCWMYEYKDNSKIEYYFIFMVFQDIITEYLYIFPARITPKMMDSFLEVASENIIFVVRNLAKEEMDFIFSQDDILMEESKQIFNDENGKYIEELYKIIVTSIKLGSINRTIILDIDYKYSLNNLSLIIMISVLFLSPVFVFLFIALKNQIVSIRSYLSNSINESEIMEFNFEIRRIKEKYYNKKIKTLIYITKSYIFYQKYLKFRVIPIEKIISIHIAKKRIEKTALNIIFGIFGFIVSAIINATTKTKESDFSYALVVWYYNKANRKVFTNLDVHELKDANKIADYFNNRDIDIKRIQTETK